MKINKKSWHYRLIYWSEGRDFRFPPTCEELDGKMPQTLCSYLYSILAIFCSIFVTMFLTVGSLAIVITAILTHPQEAKLTLITLPTFCVLAVLAWIVYNLIIDFIWKPIQKRLRNHCPRIDYE
ncbi:MAG: hypothetical protein WC460_02655 [Patescibacteria group bacterium]